MSEAGPRRAGTYARDRYRAGLRSYRRYVRPYVIGLVVSSVLLLFLARVVWNLNLWALMVVLLAGGLLAIAVGLRDEPPEFVDRWRRGADGERKTEKALRQLVAEGWKVRHDQEFAGLGNVDHLLLSPSRVAYVIETKTLNGRISVEHGTLTQRFADDSRPHRCDELAGRMRAQVERVAHEWELRTGSAPPIRSVVAIWGAFAEGQVEENRVVYVAGRELVETLRKLDADAS